jgi:hypothetical protein
VDPNSCASPRCARPPATTIGKLLLTLPRACHSISNIERVRELLSGFQEWLDAGADPLEIWTWHGLQRRLTWAPVLQLRSQVLYVEDMELKKRRKKHISADAFHHRAQDHSKQFAPRTYDIRAWLLQHALDHHLKSLGAVLETVKLSDAVTKAVASLRKDVTEEATLRIVKSPRDAEFAHELVDSMHDFITEFSERNGRLSQYAKLDSDDISRAQSMVDEVAKWVKGGVDAVQTMQQPAPWRSGHGDNCELSERLSRRWSAVFARGARVWRLLDIFDADNVAALKALVLCGLPIDMLLDEVGGLALVVLVP